ncbi:unnamed protein product [Brachionus calyciflorus]|uniref:G-protein coupled receptors family 1 profile domain-containing protein n=1 Tax=Brachionus calyciflorus TaxID=104777 RepID=A0A813VSB6_9BILA|nr:unnamed protein product [Brachionus calyciflorus]
MYINEHWKNFEPIDRKWHYLIAFIYFVIGVFGLITNFMVFYYLLKIKSVKRPGTYFLINLAIADLGKILSCLPMNAVSSYYQKWIFGQLGCDIYGIAGGLFGFVSITTMVFMSIERYLMIKNPLFALKLTNRTVLFCILITWLYSSLWIFPQLTLKNGFVLEGLLTSCTFDYLSRDSYSRLMIMFLFIGGFFIPLSLIGIFYILLFVFLKNNTIFRSYRERGNLKTQTELSIYFKTSDSSNKYLTMKLPNTNNLISSNSNISKQSDSESINTNSKYNSFIKREVKVAKSIILIVAMFCIAWLPYAIMALLAQYIQEDYLIKYVTPFTTSLPAIFAKTSSIYNPILYTLSNKDCKAYFKMLFCKKIFSFKQKNTDPNGLKIIPSETRLYTNINRNNL